MAYTKTKTPIKTTTSEKPKKSVTYKQIGSSTAVKRVATPLTKKGSSGRTVTGSGITKRNQKVY